MNTFDIYKWLAETDFSVIEDKHEGDLVVGGMLVTVITDHGMYSTAMTQKMYIFGTTYICEREGYKVISYERWVDTCWNDWEITHE